MLQISHNFLYFLVAFVLLFVTKCLLEDYGYASLESFTSPIVVKFLKYVVDVIVAIIAIAACYGTIREIYDRQLVITNKLGGAEFLGQISLGIYAIQFPVVNMFIHSFEGYSLPTVISLSFILTCILSVSLVQGFSHNRIIGYLLLGKK